MEGTSTSPWRGRRRRSPGLAVLAVLGATVVAGVLQADAARRILQDHDPHNEGRLFKSALGFLPLLAYLLGGVFLVAGNAGGLGWLAAGATLAIIGGLLVSWVVLLEVLR